MLFWAHLWSDTWWKTSLSLRDVPTDFSTECTWDADGRSLSQTIPIETTSGRFNRARQMPILAPQAFCKENKTNDKIRHVSNKNVCYSTHNEQSSFKKNIFTSLYYLLDKNLHTRQKQNETFLLFILFMSYVLAYF